MTATRRRSSVMNHPVVIVFLIIAIVASMSLAAEVLKPLALSVLLAFALTPLASLLERRARLPRLAAVLLTVTLALITLGGIGYVVGRQLSALANRLPAYRENIDRKLTGIGPRDDSSLAKAQEMANDVADKLNSKPLASRQALEVHVVEQPSFRERLQAAVGPYLEFLGVGSFVLILVLFMMMNREDLRDRVVGLFGHGRVSLTTRTMDEIGQRISRYLGTFAAVNSGFGLVIGLGLWAVGIPYAVLWGCLAALLRFIPYVGPAIAFVLPVVFSIAHFPGWKQPIEVLILFGIVETVLNSFLEPVIYGRTTGVSALGLLVAAMFWTWLWGLLGILLSTPLTVCLAVLGKYVPSLSVFATLLGEEADLDPDIRFYQRLVALDRDGAVEVVESSLRTKPRVEVFDTILIPALSRAERDGAEGYLEEQDLAFVWRVVGEIVDDLEGTPELTLATVATAGAEADALAEPGRNGHGGKAEAEVPVVLGFATNNTADTLALKMLAQLLTPSGLVLEIVNDAPAPLALAGRVEELSPSLVVLSHMPPEGLTPARYQVKRLRARFADLPIVVGRWGASGNVASAAERLSEVGASHVSQSLAEAREDILDRVHAHSRPAGEVVAGLLKTRP